MRAGMLRLMADPVDKLKDVVENLKTPDALDLPDVPKTPPGDTSAPGEWAFPRIMTCADGGRTTQLLTDRASS